MVNLTKGNVLKDNVVKLNVDAKRVMTNVVKGCRPGKG